MNTQTTELAERAKRLGINKFHISTGPKWIELSPEERAQEIHRIFDAVEHGDLMPVRNIDGPPWFPMPRCHIQDFDQQNWKYKKFRILNWMHGYAWKFDQWYQEIEWKIKKLAQTGRK